MNKYDRFIKSVIGKRELYEQLAEECSELAQASLKQIRSGGYSPNKTNLTMEETEDNFREEVMDVLLLMAMIYGKERLEFIAHDIPYNPKLKRWAYRLGFKEGDGDGMLYQ